MGSIEWRDRFPAVGDADVERVETEIGFRFPRDFIECAKLHHGGVPSPRTFKVRTQAIGDFRSGLGALLSFRNDDNESLAMIHRVLRSQLPEKVVAFGTDGGGDYVCFDYRKTPAFPSIVYWAHEFPVERGLISLAKTFTDFLALLEPRENSSATMNALTLVDRDKFEYWLMDMDESLSRFINELPRELASRMDYLPPSLQVIEEWLLSRYRDTKSMLPSVEARTIDGAARYVGEVFRRNLGGKWAIDFSDVRNVSYGLPQLKGLPKQAAPLCPLTLVTASADRRTGVFMGTVFENNKRMAEIQIKH